MGGTDTLAEIKYKTVNIYSISLVSWRRIVKELEEHISEGKVNDYYEIIFAKMVTDGALFFETVSFDSKPWYEIDTLEDLEKSEELFSSTSYTATKTVSHSQADLPDMKIINAVQSRLKKTEVLNVRT
jgi:NDP-sugar pyrophosphorylase family protein